MTQPGKFIINLRRLQDIIVGEICKALSFISPNDVREVRKQGIEMMKQKLSFALQHLIRALQKIILPRKFRNDMNEGMSVANNKNFIYYGFIFVY